MSFSKRPNQPARTRVAGAILLALAALTLSACGGGGTTPYTAPASGGSSGGGSSGGGSTGGGSSGGGSSGGGGTTATASPYGLFASTYIGYTAQTNGAYLHSIQGGDVYTGSGGNIAYGNYSAGQPDMNRTGLYIVQTQASGTKPSTASDYYYVAVLAPGDASFDISQSNALVIQMGNTITPSASAGNATVFTVGINDGKGSTPAANNCTFNQTLSSVGGNVALSALGVRTYVIPLSSFTTCSAGSMAAMQTSGITTVGVTIVGSNNSAMVAGEYDTIAIGTIGFTTGVTAADTTALAQ
jgi:hypothetical protein